MLKVGSRLLTRALSARLVPPLTVRPFTDPAPDQQPPPAAAPAEGSDGPRYIPRRACLYVPGDDEKKLRKIPEFGVDCAILDCEDGVAINRKVEARTTICRMLDELEFGRTEPIVRVNAVDSGLAEDDLKAVLQAQKLPLTWMLPKVEEPDHIDWFSKAFQSTLKSLKRKLTPQQLPIKLIIFTESAAGLLRLEEICRRGQELFELGSAVQLAGVVFGSDDFCASIGVERSTEATELAYARQKLVMIAKAFQLQAIDLVHIDYKDMEGLRRAALEGARWGFTGKQVIHPGQVGVVQEAFSPSPARVQWATDLIAAFDQHQQSGKGAFSFRGSMIDMPLVLQARNVVQAVKHFTSTPTPPASPPPTPSSAPAPAAAPTTPTAAPTTPKSAPTSAPTAPTQPKQPESKSSA